MDGITVSFVLTTGIQHRMRNDRKFANSVMRAMKRFANKDWGTVDAEDAETNDQMDASLSAMKDMLYELVTSSRQPPRCPAAAPS